MTTCHETCMNTSKVIVCKKVIRPGRRPEKIGGIDSIGFDWKFYVVSFVRGNGRVKRETCNTALDLFESLVSATFKGGSLAEMDFFTLSM